MKNQFYNHCLIIVFLFFLSPVIQACGVASFNFSVKGNVVTFVNTSTFNNTARIIMYYGDGQADTANADTFKHTYQAVGTYKACLIVNDSIFQHCDSTCRNVQIGTCPGADFDFDANGLTYTFIDNSSGAVPYLRRWVLMDISFGILKDTFVNHDTFYHTFQDTSIHFAKLMLYDSSQNFCDSLVKYFFVRENFRCAFPDFDYKVFGDTITLYNMSYGGINYKSHFSFGDGNKDTSDRDTFIYIYQNPGNYTVCLKILDSNYYMCDSLCKNILVDRCPVVDFEYSVNGKTVTFIDKSTGNLPYRKRWKLYGDTISELTYSDTFVYTYSKNGDYYAHLVAYDQWGVPCDSLWDTINVNIHCAFPDFDYDVSGDTLTVYNKSSGGSNYKSHFTFGDGQSDTSNDSTVMHYYFQKGTHQVCLTILDSANNLCDSLCKNIVIRDCPVPDFSYQVNGKQIELVNKSTGGTSYTIIWDLGDGNADTTGNKDTVLHNYQNFGSFHVIMYVFDSSFIFCDSISKIIEVKPPCAQAYFTHRYLKGNKVEFINRSSGTKPFRIAWDFGDSNFDTSANNDTVTHVYQDTGLYKVILYVFDSSNNLCDSFYQIIEVEDHCPDIDFEYLQDWKTISLIDKSTGRHQYYGKWVIINSTGNVVKDTSVNSNYTDTILHTFQNAGTYYVKYVVYDTFDNVCDSLTKVVVVEPCIASYYVGLDTTQKYKIFIIENSKGKTSSTQYLWIFGDGDSSTQQNPVHTYASFGAYQLCLKIFDSSTGCSSTYCDTIGLDSNGNFYRSGAFQIIVINEDDLINTIEIKEPIHNLKIYPNPTSGKLTVTLDANSNEPVEIKVYNILGQNVLELSEKLTSGENTFNIHLDNVNDGIYFLRIKAGNQVKTVKIKKETN